MIKDSDLLPKADENTFRNLPKNFIPLSQLGAVIAGRSTDETVRQAQELYDREPTRAHFDNLRDAAIEHAVAGRKS